MSSLMAESSRSFLWKVKSSTSSVSGVSRRMMMEERVSLWVSDARSFLSNQISDSRTVPGAVNLPEIVMGVSPK